MVPAVTSQGALSLLHSQTSVQDALSMDSRKTLGTKRGEHDPHKRDRMDSLVFPLGNEQTVFSLFYTLQHRKLEYNSDFYVFSFSRLPILSGLSPNPHLQTFYGSEPLSNALG